MRTTRSLTEGPLLALSLVLFLSVYAGSCHRVGTGDAGESASEDVADRTPAGLVADWVEMWNAYDLDQVGELFLTDGRLTYFSSEYEGVIRGFDAVLEHHRGFGFVQGGEERGTRLWVEELTEAVLGEAAILTGIWYFDRSGALSGNEAASTGVASVPQRGPVTFVCILDGGLWRFAHMNFGTYLDPGAADG